MEFVMQAIEPFPWRAGGPPRTTAANPQQQLDQIPNLADYEAMREIVTAWPSVIRRPSLRAPYGTLGMFLSDHDAQGPKEAFLLGTEFAHLHPLPDGSLHMVLPPEVHHAAIQRGWASPIRWPACRPYRPKQFSSSLRTTRLSALQLQDIRMRIAKVHSRFIGHSASMNPVILDDVLVDFDGDHAGRRHHFACLDVELAIVKIALDYLALDEPFRKRARGAVQASSVTNNSPF